MSPLEDKDIPKNKIVQYILNGKEPLEKKLKTVEKVSYILDNKLTFEYTKPKKDSSKPVWDLDNSGLDHPWVWLANYGINIILPENYLDLQNLIIFFTKKFCSDYYIKKFEKSKTIKLFIVLKKDEELPLILDHHHICPYFIGMHNLLKAFL